VLQAERLSPEQRWNQDGGEHRYEVPEALLGDFDSVSDRPLDENESTSNRAQHAEYGEIREARELWALGYTKSGWICVDEKCRARMVPCAWERPNEKGKFCNEDGVPYQRPPYFRAEPAHVKGCNASLQSAPRDRPTPEIHIGHAVDYPNRVILFQSPQRLSSHHPDKQGEPEKRDECTDRRHARWTRSIQEVCEYYADHPEQHWRSLRVDRCQGITYDECFVKLGTGERKNVGRNYIFYDEIRFKDWIVMDAEPVVLPLLSSVNGVSRRLVVPTAHWLPNYQRAFRRQLKTALKEGRAAHREGRRQRPWIFFFGREESYDQIEFRAELQPGVEVLVCAMPRLHWNYRPSARFVMPTRRQPPYGDYVQPETSPRVTFVEPSKEPTEVDAVEQSVETEAPISDIIEPALHQLPEPARTEAEVPPSEVLKREVATAGELIPACGSDEIPAPVVDPAAIEWAEGDRAPAAFEEKDSPPPGDGVPAPVGMFRRLFAKLNPWRGT
jgi:hypothetical protein